MSTILYELPDRYVLDTGQVAGKHVRAVRDVLAGLSLDGRIYVDSPDLERFAKHRNQTPVRWTSGDPDGPHSNTREWDIPESYRHIHLEDYFQGKLEELFGRDERFQVMEDRPNAALITTYLERLTTELEFIQARGMQGFVQSLIYMVDVFRANKVVWGVGRGSCVESLALFLIGVHMIDPIQHEIELEHFFK